jgi:hypothetical protein
MCNQESAPSSLALSCQGRTTTPKDESSHFESSDRSPTSTISGCDLARTPSFDIFPLTPRFDLMITPRSAFRAPIAPPQMPLGRSNSFEIEQRRSLTQPCVDEAHIEGILMPTLAHSSSHRITKRKRDDRDDESEFLPSFRLAPRPSKARSHRGYTESSSRSRRK